MKRQVIRERVWLKFDKHCAYCGKEIKYKEMQVDHFMPKAGKRPIGRDLDGNYVYPDKDAFENLMPSCRRCNHYKRAENIETFRFLMKTIHERISQNYICKVALDYGIMTLKPFGGLFYYEKNLKT